MRRILLELPANAWSAIGAHLLPSSASCEEAAFLFAEVAEKPDAVTLRMLEWRAVPPEGFALRSPYYLQLTDVTRAAMIKRAHDLSAALVELHSHPFQACAEFSPSDLSGLSEFVPHVRWRLRRRPYAAVVVARDSFDALAWADDQNHAFRLTAIVAGGQELPPTRHTPLDLTEGSNEQLPI
jgi:hypothetical protein